jgi:CCR4-NOT transcription complex subunit 1
VKTLANLDGADSEIPASRLATAALKALRGLPDISRDGSGKNQVYLALEARYSKQELPVPAVIRSAMSLVEILEERPELALELLNQGPASTASLDAAKEAVRRLGRSVVNAEQVSSALLLIILTPHSTYRADIFVAATRELAAETLNWHDVVRGFDRRGLGVTQEQFLALYHALLPIAEDGENFDIQVLWGGQWQHAATQLSFALAFASLSPEQLDATTIPGLRQAYDPKGYSDGPEDVVALIDEASRDPMISLDAAIAITEAVWNSISPVSSQDAMTAKQVIGDKMTFFLCSAGAIPKPWSASHQSFMARMVVTCLIKSHPNYNYVLHSLWKQDKHWLASRLIEVHSEEPLQLPIVLEHAHAHGWLDDLLTMLNGLGVDLAALAHRKGLHKIEDWAEDKLGRGLRDQLIAAIAKFLEIKAQDEMRTVQNKQMEPRTVGLSMKTVHAMLLILDEQMTDRPGELIKLQRQCMQAFPRLINYGEGFDEIIEANGEESNLLQPVTDAEMQDLYKRMYSSELEVRDIIEALQACKISNEPGRQDLFACMIHGLFDEYVCFNEYPLGPLATTAVLFGGIISFRLISNITLAVGLEMVLEAVRDYGPDTSMYKFGLQALLHFLNRLSEWPEICQQLVYIQGLQGTEAYARAQEVLRDVRNGPSHVADPNGVNGTADVRGLTNGNAADPPASDSLAPQFTAVRTDTVPNPELYEDPDEEVRGKVSFVLNNVSEQNLADKTQELVNHLKKEHHHWFANYLVEQRAKSQANFHHIYLHVLGALDDSGLWADVLRETYASIRKVLNADSTMKSTAERTVLKNLGIWLGSLTIARDKPIKHKNISFKDLLLEGWETERLLLVIPFTCEVLTQGTKSVVFKPPNPWVMEIIGLLLELYDLPDLKIQQKFAVEVLLGNFGLPRKGEGMERSTELKKRRPLYEDETAAPVHDSLEFDDMAIGGLAKGLHNARFSPSTLASSLPDLETQLSLPPATGGPLGHARLRQVVVTAIQRAIVEIISPVIERSVTIATIATKDLIHKDYAQEPDEDRVREAFEQMAKALAGSLALVTCKEPLRMSMTNYIRLGVNEMPDQTFPEGAILMCVNDNLDIACSFVEKQAEERALPEIEPHIEAEIALRRRHKADFPNEPYRDPISSHWSGYIPEPYKQLPGGLNQQQLDIYLQFARQTRGVIANHGQTASTDSGKQIPDVLQIEPGFPAMPNLTTPAEQPAIPHQTQQQGRMLPPAMPPSHGPSQVNGYLDGATIQDHVSESLAELNRLSRVNPDQHFKHLGRDSPIMEVFVRLISIVRASPDIDNTALPTANLVCQALYEESTGRFEVEVLAELLNKMCQLSMNAAIKVVLLFRNQDEAHVLNVPVTTALLEAGLMEFSYVDMTLARLLQQQNPVALSCMAELLDSILFVKHPVALRADFVSSLGALGEWLIEQPDLPEAKSIMKKLRTAGVPEVTDVGSDEASLVKHHQMQYIFSEWTTLFSHPEPSDGMFVAFISQLHQRQILNSQEDMVLFLRLSIETAADMDLATEPSEAYFNVDALARFIVLLVKNRGEGNEAVKGSKSGYMKSILSLIILILNNHHVMRGEHFNQRMFYRLFSGLLYDWHDFVRGSSALQDKEMILVFADAILLLDPLHFPGFTFGCLSLLSHRVFMPTILKLPGDEVGPLASIVASHGGTNTFQGQEAFTKIMEMMLYYASDLLKPVELTDVAKMLYQGVLRILLVLHHDFPEFLAENHFRLCNTVPAYCTQLRNLVLSAFPSSIQELPDPFTVGLKIDRLEEMRVSPTLAGDIIAPLRRWNVKETIDGILQKNVVSDDSVAQIADAIDSANRESALMHPPSNLDMALLQSILLYLAQTAISTAESKPRIFFSSASPQACLMSKLAKELHPEVRYLFLNAVVNQLRYPNSHTHFFNQALLHLFGNDHADQQESDVRQQITRVMLERLIVHRPHPWGLIVTLLELLKNSSYMFWELPFIKAAPEVGASLRLGRLSLTLPP